MPIGLLSLKMLKYLLATALNYMHMLSLYQDELLQQVAGRGGGGGGGAGGRAVGSK